jgi:hypothetical protein
MFTNSQPGPYNFDADPNAIGNDSNSLSVWQVGSFLEVQYDSEFGSRAFTQVKSKWLKGFSV